MGRGGERVRLVIDYEWAGQVFIALLIPLSLLAVGYVLRDFHRQGMERVRAARR